MVFDGAAAAVVVVVVVVVEEEEEETVVVDDKRARRDNVDNGLDFDPLFCFFMPFLELQLLDHPTG